MEGKEDKWVDRCSQPIAIIDNVKVKTIKYLQYLQSALLFLRSENTRVALRRLQQLATLCFINNPKVLCGVECCVDACWGLALVLL